MQKLKIILLFLVAVGSANAQRLTEKSFIVKLDGDTAYCDIDNKKWDKSPKEIKVNKGSDNTIYEPGDIAAFFVAGEYFLSANVSLDKSPYRIGELDDYSEPQMYNDTVFIQVIWQSPDLKLLRYKDQMAKVHFLIQKGSEPVESLIFKKYNTKITRNNIIRKAVGENNKFRLQLLKLFEGCPSISGEISRLPYEQTSLVDLFNKYTQCMQLEKGMLIDTVKTKTIEFQLVAGVTSPQLEFHDVASPLQQLNEMNLKSSLSPVLGVGYNLISAKRTHLTFSSNFLISLYNIEGQEIDIRNENDFVTTDFSFKGSAIIINAGIGLRPLRSLPNLYFNGFLTAEMIAGSKSEVIQTTFFYGNERVRDLGVLGFETKTFPIGYSFNVGYKIKKISFECILERVDGISKGLKAPSELSKLYFNLRYDLRSK